MAQTIAAHWRVELWYRGVLRQDARCPAVVVGDGGDVVVPGLAGAHELTRADRVLPVPGLELVADVAPTTVVAVGERVALRVVAHPEVELVLVRERVESIPISRMPIWPWREAVYGLAFAACMASLVSVKVAVSPVRNRQEDDRVMARELLDDVPIAFVMPPAFVEAPPPDDGDGEGATPVDAPTLVDDGNTEVEPVSEVAQLDPTAKPKPTSKSKTRKRGRDADEFVEMSAILASADSAQVSALDLFVDDTEVRGQIIGIAEPVHEPETVRPMIVLGGETSPKSQATVDAAPAAPAAALPSEAARRADEDTEGIVAPPKCELEYDAKDRLDIVFVVDATAPMAKVLWTLAERVPELHREIADKTVRYGLVAFADDVELVRLDALTKDEVRVALLALSADAQDREPDADVRDDVLGALDRARGFPWGETRDTLRMMVLVTDNDYGDRGDHLGEHTVKKSHARVVDELSDDSIRVTTVTRRKVPGLDEGRDGHESVPAATGGIALRESTLYAADGLADALRDVLRNPVCRKNIVDVLVDG